jgi:hypothetical protein
MTADDNRPQRPTDKLTALRLGRRLVIRPIVTAADRDARHEGRARPDRNRTFKIG